MREYQQPVADGMDENVKVLMKTIQATEAQLQQTEQELRVCIYI